MHNETVSPEMQKEIEGFCNKITTIYDIDNEIKEELYGHIEDKLPGYLSGEVELTEDDAFVLVSEHFGKPEIIKKLLREHMKLKRRRHQSGS